MADDIDRLEALKNGSKKAFEAIYKQYAGKLYHFIIRLSHGNPYMAEEILQATFVKLWEIHPQVNPQKSILFYLSSIAKNMLFNRYQRQTIEFLYQENLAREKSFCDSDTEKEIDRKWFEEYLHQVAEKLPPARKKIFILSRLKDLSTKQIAEMMQISISTVETQLTLATKFVREQCEKDYDKLFFFFSMLSFV
ncbi:RNA polymerase sigma-70 factor [Tannerella sp.]|uniref:RNA polymerase sigma-70 factor n=1 Tax=Tannerella sp. TaxID=2382127 RepID=UPI0026DCBE66|nr:RNA polymerase sigma-70 factor [Tannerella sp.]MDO4703222.1 RNA polymerase sigma-70 factor [Tannerella sp.]